MQISLLTDQLLVKSSDLFPCFHFQLPLLNGPGWHQSKSKQNFSTYNTETDQSEKKKCNYRNVVALTDV